KKMERAPGFDVWPPDVTARDSKDEPARLKFNAYATWEKPDGKKVVPLVRVTDLFLKDLVKGDADVLAFFVGHELGHLHHRHVLKRAAGRADLTRVVYSQKEELEADAFGADLARKAGFSVVRAALLTSRRLRDLRYHAAPLDALRSTHPAWDDRFARIVQDPRVWEALATFENGVALLAAEHFFAAERC